MQNGRFTLAAVTALLAASFTTMLVLRADPGDLGLWPLAGHDLSNTRSQPDEHMINTSNVGTLTPKWVFTTGGDVSATPTVAGNAVYFPDWAGNLYAVNKDTGQLIWSQQISTYDAFSTAISRVSPAVYGDELIIGDNENPNAIHDGANIIAVDRQSGALRWITNVESYPAAIITGSPVVFGRTVYVGVSSNEESTLAHEPTYTQCCAFRGSVVALDADSGAILWKTYDMPDNHGALDQYSGGAIWQPPAIDPQRGLLYIGTGNNYTVPASVEACEQTAQAAGNTDADCTAPDDYFDAALALDLSTGAVRWAHKRLHRSAGSIEWNYGVEDYDAWTTGCRNTPPINCASPPGPDYDLGGSGPNLFPNMVGFGQKSGDYWAFNPDNGDVLWTTFVGPAGTGTLGGIEWGTATDGQRIYAEVADSGKVPFTLIPSGATISWGSWSALDVNTGTILWQTADPTPGSEDFGAVSVANGVVYAGSQSTSGYMYALDAQTGAILWKYASGGSVVDGPAIVNGVVYWGSGYRIGTHNNKLYAFTLASH
jgi:polyvinyl alcohol dehydrogenase (cytochrome)